MADAVEALLAVDDADGLRQVFALADAIKAHDDMRFGHVGPARARAGLSIAPGDVAGDAAAIARETAIAGDAAAAQKLVDQLPAEARTGYSTEAYAGALAALGKSAELRALIATAGEEDRLKLSGIWLLTAIRAGEKLTDPLAEVMAQLAAAPPKGVTWFPSARSSAPPRGRIAVASSRRSIAR